MSSPALIILVRHAESEHHVRRLTGGWTDTPLTERGHEQSVLLARRLREELGEREIRLYTSDLQRAVQTAQHIGDAFGVQAQRDERLREHNNGDAANLTLDEAAARYPMTWNAPVGIDVRPFRDAETPRAFYERAGAFIDEVPADGPLPVIVSHGGTMICLIGRWLQLTAEALEPIGFVTHTTGITVLQSDEHGSRIIERMNDVAHLSGMAGSALLATAELLQ